jgi:hypothetical protein
LAGVFVNELTGGTSFNVGIGNVGSLNVGGGNVGEYNVGFGNFGTVNFGSGNVGDFNLGNGNAGNLNIGSGNAGDGNVGFGNLGDKNVGLGNNGSGNVGFGNTGTGNIGFGNTGTGNIGFGLTGTNQIGFGGFNSGTGNIGLFNSGTGNAGLFNSGSGNWGVGNSGSTNTGAFNSGDVNSGLGNAGSVNTGWHNVGSYNSGNANIGDTNTGAANTGDINTGWLNSGGANTGLANRGDLNTGAFNTGTANNGFGWRGVGGGQLDIDIGATVSPIPIRLTADIPVNIPVAADLGALGVDAFTIGGFPITTTNWTTIYNQVFNAQVNTGKGLVAIKELWDFTVLNGVIPVSAISIPVVTVDLPTIPDAVALTKGTDPLVQTRNTSDFDYVYASGNANPYHNYYRNLSTNAAGLRGVVNSHVGICCEYADVLLARTPSGARFDWVSPAASNGLSVASVLAANPGLAISFSFVRASGNAVFSTSTQTEVMQAGLAIDLKVDVLIELEYNEDATTQKRDVFATSRITEFD